MAEKMTINIPHKLTREEVKSRLENGFDKVQKQMGGIGATTEQSWSGNIMSFTAGAMGQNITGTMTLQEGNVLIEVDLPWLLAKLSGGISDKLKKGTQLLLDKK